MQTGGISAADIHDSRSGTSAKPSVKRQAMSQPTPQKSSAASAANSQCSQSTPPLKKKSGSSSADLCCSDSRKSTKLPLKRKERPVTKKFPHSSRCHVWQKQVSNHHLNHGRRQHSQSLRHRQNKKFCIDVSVRLNMELLAVVGLQQARCSPCTTMSIRRYFQVHRNALKNG